MQLFPKFEELYFARLVKSLSLHCSLSALAKWGSFGGHFLAWQYAKLQLPVKLYVKLPNYYGVDDTEMEGLQSEISDVYFMLAKFLYQG